MDFRAGLPFETGGNNRALDIIEAALALAGIPDDEVVSLHQLPKHGFLDIVQHRRKVLLVNMAKHTDIPSMVGKCFPRLVIYGANTVQYSLLLGNMQQAGTADKMGEVLNPMVELSFANSTYRRTEARAMLAMGVFPHLCSPAANWTVARKATKTTLK